MEDLGQWRGNIEAIAERLPTGLPLQQRLTGRQGPDGVVGEAAVVAAPVKVGSVCVVPLKGGTDNVTEERDRGHLRPPAA